MTDGEIYAAVSRAKCSTEDNAAVDAITEAIVQFVKSQEVLGAEFDIDLSDLYES